MAGSLTPDWPRRIVALVAAAVALAWATPFSQVAIIAAGALIGRLAARAAADRRDEPRAQSDLAPDGPARAGRVRRAAAGPPARARRRGASRWRCSTRSTGPAPWCSAAATSSCRCSTRRSSSPGWVSDGQFLAGYGAAQAVPGPLFTFASYLGAVAGPIPNGVPGAAIAHGRHLPAVVPADLRGAPVLGPAARVRRRPAGVDRDERGGRRDPARGPVTPIWTSAITGPADIAVAAAALALLLTDRVPPVAVVGLCALAGQALAIAVTSRIIALGERGHQLPVAGQAALVADRPEPGAGEPAVVGQGELGRQGRGRIDVDRLPARGRARIAGHRADRRARRRRTRRPRSGRVSGGAGGFGQELRVVGRDPDGAVAQARGTELRTGSPASACRTAAGRGWSSRPARPSAAYRSSDHGRSASAPSRRSIGAEAPTSDPA